MATVELRFSALPAHVRTARLVAAAVARRAGVEESVLDEVRLAVGEACSRAVDIHRAQCPEELVALALRDEPGTFRVDVQDRGRPALLDAPDLRSTLEDSASLEHGALPDSVGLAVITGLVDDLDVRRADTGTSVRMSWPAASSSSPR